MPVHEIISNISLLLVLSIFSRYIREFYYNRKFLHEIFQGLLFGIIAIIGMIFPYHFDKGIIFDGRTIVLSLCSYFFGPLSGRIAAVLALTYRIVLGNSGIIMGVSTILSAFLVGTIFYYFKQKRTNKTSNFIDTLMVSLITHLLMFILLLTLPKYVIPNAIKILGISILLVYPFFSLILGILLLDQESRNRIFSELKSTNQLLESVFNNQFTLLAILDKNFNFLKVNKAFAEAEKKNVDFFVGKNFFTLYQSDTKQFFEEVVRTKQPYQAFARPLSYADYPERGISYWDWTLQPIINSEGNIDYLILSLRNVTERIKLEETRERLVSIIENTSDLVGIADINGKIMYANKAAKKLLEIDTEDILLNLSISDAHPEDVAKFIMNVAIPEANQKGIWNGKTTFLSRRGKKIEMLQTIIAHKDVDDKVIFYSTIAKDLSDIKRFEEQLVQSELKYRQIVENLSDAIMIHKEGFFVYVNPAGLKLLEANSFEEIKDIPVINFVHPDYRKIAMNRIRKIYDSGIKAEQIEEKLITLKGNEKDVLVRGIPIQINAEGGIASMAIVTDITELKREMALKELLMDVTFKLVEYDDLEKFFNYLYQKLSIHINLRNLFLALYDEKNNKLFAPFEWDEKVDSPVTWDAEGSLTGLVIKEKSTLFFKFKELEKLINTGKIKQIGSIAKCWLGVPIIFSGRVLGAIVIQDYYDENVIDDKVKDLLETIANFLSIFIIRKIQQEELVLMKKAVDESPIFILITDCEGNIQYVNNAFTETTGYEREKVIGKNPRILKSGFHPEEFYKNLWNTIKAGQTFTAEFYNRKRNGELYWERKSIIGLKDKDGKITNFISFGIDITERKQMMEELIIARAKAEEAVRIMNNFLLAMSHEIRTPLNPLLGFTALILEYFENQVDENVSRWFQAVKNNAERLEETVDKILDYENIESGQYISSSEKIDIKELIEKIVNRLSIKAMNKNLSLNIYLPDEGIEMESDKHAIETIISNLVDNAIKFTMKGSVEIKVEKLPDSVKIIVKDTGIGMSDEYQKFLYQAFSQEMMGYGREYEGTGLGLALSKKYIDMLNGEIHIYSKKGEGTTIEVNLPQQKSSSISS